jgi:two-component system, OmpR family, sensor kinase
MSIRTKLILWYSGLLAIIIVIFGAAVFSVMRWALISTVDRTLDTAIDQVQRNSRAWLVAQFGPPESIQVQLPELDAFGLSGVLVQVWDLSTTPATLKDMSSNIAGYPSALDTNALRWISDNTDNNQLYSNITKNGSEWRVVTERIDVWGQPIAIQIATSSQAIKEATGLLVVVMLWAGALSIMGSMVLGMWLSWRVLQPVKEITNAAESIVATDNLKTRLPWSGPMDELGHMTSVFNRMMERIEHLFSVQQRFVADVSHELRTPLTAIRGNLDLIKRYGMDENSLEAMESEVARMSRLVSDLLLLARADYGEIKMELEPIDLDTVLSEVYREARVLAKDRDLAVKIIDFDPVRVNGNGDRIKQLLLNLVSNALKFTPDGGQITMNLRQEDYDAVLEVSDTGIGISEEDRKRIFDRFFQSDTSRARHTTDDGVGLGLSIAKWIVDSHHGTIEVESTPGEGATFRVKIPALDVKPHVSNRAVTRPRLGIIRRVSPTGQHRTKSKL